MQNYEPRRRASLEQNLPEGPKHLCGKCWKYRWLVSWLAARGGDKELRGLSRRAVGTDLLRFCYLAAHAISLT